MCSRISKGYEDTAHSVPGGGPTSLQEEKVERKWHSVRNGNERLPCRVADKDAEVSVPRSNQISANSKKQTQSNGT
jgi:hypothetical protein